MSFRSVFLGVVIAFALVLAAFLINRARPRAETEQPSAQFVRASGKCAECHARMQVHPLESFIYGAPPMAPLLFPNLTVLGLIALWQLRANKEYLTVVPLTTLDGGRTAK